MAKSSLEKHFELLLLEKRMQKNFEGEYRFHPKRKWRFDYADVAHKIAVEIEGGIWSGGRHTRGSGYAKDVEKYNEATKLGWRILRYTSKKDMATFIDDYTVLINQEKDIPFG